MVMWSRKCRHVPGVFVPKGLDEGSQAIYCLERVSKGIRPGGYGMSWSTVVFTAQGCRTFLPPNHTVP